MWQGKIMGELTRRGRTARLRAAWMIAAVTGMAAAAGIWPAPVGVASAAPRPAHAAAAADPGQTACTPNGTGETCAGTFSGDTAYDPTLNGDTGGMTGITPSVTVDQVANLSNQVLNVSWSGFTPTYDPFGTGVNAGELGNISYGVTILECKGADPQYDGFYGTASAGDPADACYFALVAGTATAGPNNAVIGVTLPGTADASNEISDGTVSCSSGQPGDTLCGTGTAQVQIETKEQNSFLGCDSTQPCSLVVLPMWGGWDGLTGSTDAADPADTQGQLGYTADCSNHTLDSPFFGDSLATMQDWGDSCAWADRMVIPLSFAPTPAQFCPSSRYAFAAEGAPELEKAMQQWQPAWCSASQSPIDFGYDSAVGEYTARSDFLNGGSALTAGTDVALVTDPAPSQSTSASSRQFTYAPIVNTGIAIAYYVDDVQTGLPVTNLKLDARLLAKLLTDSYSYSFDQCSSGQSSQTQTCDPAVSGNPADIFQDPEFYQLNPEYDPSDFQDQGTNDDDSAPIVLAGNSDMTEELTRWIESDPAARAFLAGEPDQWGMHVNDYFKTGQTYPVSAFEGLDPGYSQSEAQALLDPPGWVATMQAVWNPVTGQDNVDGDLLGWTSTALSFNEVCTLPGGSCPTTNGYNQTHNAQESYGARTLFAVVDTGDSAAYQFPTAELVNPAGNAVGPTTEAMTAALDSMKTNPDKVTQYQDYADTSPDAYPLTEVQYAMVPTCKLAPAKAIAVSRFLGKVADSQLYGTATGELPDFGGYLALDGAQQARTVAAAQAVASQDCASSPPDTTVSGQKPSGSGSAAGGGGSAGRTRRAPRPPRPGRAPPAPRPPRRRSRSGPRARRTATSPGTSCPRRWPSAPCWPSAARSPTSWVPAGARARPSGSGGCVAGAAGPAARPAAARTAVTSMADLAPTAPLPGLAPGPGAAGPDPDVPRAIAAPVERADRFFRALLRSGGLAVFAITGLIALFLVTQAWSALRRAGWAFFTTSVWLPDSGHFGIAAVLPDGIVIAAVALLIAVPVALTAAVFVAEYAPPRLRKPLIAAIDLMAAIPSIVYALWGVFFLQPRVVGTARWVSDHLGAAVPILKVPGGEAQSLFTSSPFMAGLVVSLMVIPIIASICREVYSQAPTGEREAAYALGSTRWGMIRAVVLPYGRGGTIGAVMLGFGRAMGETIAVSLVISPAFFVNWHVLEHDGMSIPALIALRYQESTPEMLSALMAAGLVLFAVTLTVNAAAGAIVTRSRSGQQTAD